jgi:nitrate/nitrite transport system ATP-binding protein
LVGVNGVGKTTLLRAVVGLGSPAAGAVLRAAGPVGYVPQDYRASLFPWFSVRQNLRLARFAGPAKSTADLDADIAEALRVVPIPPRLLERAPWRLSGGEQQLITIARALVGAPRLLVLDEPCTALDARTRATLIGRLDGWIAAHRVALVLVSHSMEEVARLTDRAIVLGARGDARAIPLRGVALDRGVALLHAELEDGRDR